MDERQQQEELKRHQHQLDAERQKLTEEQQQKHDRFCALLKENEAYSIGAALEGARAIHALDGTQRLGHDLRDIAYRASQTAEVEKQKELEAWKAGQEKQKGAADEKAAQDLQRQKEQAERGKDALPQPTPEPARAQQPAARQETFERDARRFEDGIKQRQAETHAANISRAAEAAQSRPNYARYDEMREQQSRGSKPATPQSCFDQQNTPQERQAENWDSRQKGEGQELFFARDITGRGERGNDHSRSNSRLGRGGGGRSGR